MKRRIDFNAPVTLAFALISLIVLIITYVTGGWLAGFLAARFTSWLDPMMYVRLVTHIFAHASFSHYSGNFMMILLIGPMIEEKYGSYRLVMMMLVTALITGLVNIVFFPSTAVLGASGIVFMLILLASFANVREGTIPLTVILVAILYVGNEIATGILSQDNISQISHIIGGICGTAFGFIFSPRVKN